MLVATPYFNPLLAYNSRSRKTAQPLKPSLRAKFTEPRVILTCNPTIRNGSGERATVVIIVCKLVAMLLTRLSPVLAAPSVIVVEVQPPVCHRADRPNPLRFVSVPCEPAVVNNSKHDMACMGSADGGWVSAPSIRQVQGQLKMRTMVVGDGTPWWT